MASVARVASAIEWHRPWFAPLRENGALVCSATTGDERIADALNRFSAANVRFTPAETLPANQAYEAFIGATGCVPTRDNLHDLFNGLIWHTFPRTKRCLNKWQAVEIAQRGIGATRGPLRDALTVFDENGALLQAPDALWHALLERNWRRLFVDLRPLWRDAKLILFGHALLEKLCRPRKAITAHVLRLPYGHAPSDRLDTELAKTLDRHALAGKPFIPLPVLGIPGWCPENDDAAFYDDAEVFRPPRAAGLNCRMRPPLACAGSFCPK